MISYKFYDGDLSEIKIIWEDIFKDPECFTGFYFSELCNDNKILVAIEQEKIIGMVHLNPYTVIYNGIEENVYYIVGVCVKEEYRFKGIMKEMMHRAMDYMRILGMKFTFLMPKDEAYYRGLGFENIYTNLDIKYIRLEKNDVSSRIRTNDISEYSDEELSVLSDSINKLLAGKYLFYSKRDNKYLKNLINEHKCQHGSVMEVFYENNFIGYFSYDIYADEDERFNNMFVERFVINREYIIDVLNAIKEIGIKKKCRTISVTVPYFATEDDLIWKNDLIDFEAGNIKLYKGKGIMAYSFEGQKNLDLMKNNSFFDEIV